VAGGVIGVELLEEALVRPELAVAVVVGDEVSVTISWRSHGQES